RKDCIVLATPGPDVRPLEARDSSALAPQGRRLMYRRSPVDLEDGSPSEYRVTSSPSQRRALAIFALAAVATLVWLSLPLSSGLFLGTLLAFSLLRVHERLSRRLGRPALSAVLLAVASALATLGSLVVLVYFIVARGMIAASNLAREFEPEGTFRKLLTRLDEATRNSPFGPIDVTARVHTAAAEAASKLAELIPAIAGATFSALLTLFFTIMAAVFVLRHWTGILARAERMLPLHRMHTRVVFAEFQKVGREVFIGTVLTGLAQGLLAGLGYAIGGVPEPALLGALTAVCSLVPALGTLLVWVPVGIGLIVSGHVGAGIFELVWGALVVGILSDYVIRPKLVGAGGHVPTLLTFISLFGGVKLFGLMGLIVGPVIAAVALALVRTYDREICEPDAEEALSQRNPKSQRTT
ncbi:MAG TPA: AI-2E family transporter, partial [Polyangiaceae bacterium]|nr:AI-2E family transporter [Polyangiaceae bacterium]